MDAQAATGDLEKTLHKTIKKVSEDIEDLRFNTAISAMMVLVNACHKSKSVPRQVCEALACLLHPFAPHTAEEMWENLGHAPSIQAAPWPTFDPALCEDDLIELPVQINGKKRDVIQVAKDADEESAMAQASELVSVKKALQNGEIKKVIWVPGRILNLIIK